jgi:polar amino acid transport system substrate-binding protein
MKRRTGIPRALVVLATVALLATACTRTESPGSASAGSESALDRVQKSKVLRVATINSNPPYSSLGANGQLEGFDIDTANAIAAALGAKIEWSTVNDAGRIAALQTNKADLVAANFTITPKRALTIDFTQPYLVINGQFAVKADRSDLKTLADMNKSSVRIAVSRGGTAETFVPKAVPNAKTVVFNSVADTLQALNSGQVDSISQDALYNSKLIQDHKDEYKVITGNYSTELIGLGIQQGDPKWSRWLNLFLSDYLASGEQERSFKKWFGFDMPRVEQ